MARFLDSTVFLHGYLKPRREITPLEEQTKKAAIQILTRIEQGEEVITSVVHISEVINVVESRLGLNRALELIENLLASENISISTVAKEGYEQALAIAERYGISPNDAIAALLSRNSRITDVYSFDKHFDNIPFITRIAE